MIELIDAQTQEAVIKVIGVGGCGGNAVDHMIAQGVNGVEFICANTDAQALNRSSAHHLIQLGANGLGAGGKPEKGAENTEKVISREKADVIIGIRLAAGMPTPKRLRLYHAPAAGTDAIECRPWQRRGRRSDGAPIRRGGR